MACSQYLKSKLALLFGTASAGALLVGLTLTGCGSTVSNDLAADSSQEIVDGQNGDQGNDTTDTLVPQDGDAADAVDHDPDGGQGDSFTDDGNDGGDSQADAGIDPDSVGNPDYEKDPAKITLSGPCPVEKRLGGFKVEMNETSRYTAIDGQINNAMTPSLVPEVFLENGDCKLLKRRRLVCNPGCGSNQTCGFEQTCIDMPLGQDMGLAVFRGLVKAVAINPIQPGNKYFYTKLAHPGFVADTVLQVATSGGFLPALELYGVGVQSLETVDAKWVLTENAPLNITWTVAEAGTRSRVYFEINIDVHGATPLNLVCDLPDTGEATISQEIINAFFGGGVTGFPTGKVVRRTVDSLTTGDSCVDFQVTSVRQMKVEVTGHVPCARTSDCPEGMTCNTLIQQCE